LYIHPLKEILQNKITFKADIKKEIGVEQHPKTFFENWTISTSLAMIAKSSINLCAKWDYHNYLIVP
jgi:hypothetical protein